MTSTEKDVRAANASFYQIFSDKNLTKMNALWAKEFPVGCAHPGRLAITDRSDIMKSWKEIFADPNSPQITCSDEKVLQMDLGANSVVIVNCRENLQGGSMSACNVFINDNDEWHMVYHQAGHLPAR